MIRLSSTTLISMGLASLTLTLVLAAHSLGLGSEDSQALVRARVQNVELIAAQLSAATADPSSMATILRQVTLRNPDVASAGIRDGSGMLICEVGPHAQLWGSSKEAKTATGMTALRVPISQFTETGESDWGTVEFYFRDQKDIGGFLTKVLPAPVAGVVANPTLRTGVFIAGGGFVCYAFYLRRTLRHLDPSSVIPPRVRAMLDALAEGVVVLDNKGQIVMANGSFISATGWSFKKLQGHKASKLGWATVPGATGYEPPPIPWMTALQSGQPVHGAPLAMDVKIGESAEPASPEQNAKTERRNFTVNASPIMGPDGRVRGALATFDDVTEMERTNARLKESRDEIERQNEQLVKLATTDPLTGCFNRRSFLEKFDAQWKVLQAADGNVLGCIMIDIDKFKSINDRFGHSAGDTVLKEVARLLMNSVGADNMICRYGGEEFCALLPGKDLDATAEVAEMLRATIQAEPWSITPVTISVGVSASTLGAEDPKSLLDQADKALYSSKRTGRNKVTRWGSVPADVLEPIAHAPAAIVSSDPRLTTPIPDSPLQAALNALTTALAHRNRGTALHCRRVADLCMRVAPELMTPDEASQLEAAALLHDLGKLGVPDAILLKPGPLTDEEWEVMHAHDKIGVDIAAAAGIPWPIIYVMATHHARFAADTSADADTEEPARHGQNILLPARLLSIADAYDAMVSDRPYRAGIGEEAAIAQLREGAGTQFDPELVERFIAVICPSAQQAEVGPTPLMSPTGDLRKAS